MQGIGIKGLVWRRPAIKDCFILRLPWQLAVALCTWVGPLRFLVHIALRNTCKYSFCYDMAVGWPCPQALPGMRCWCVLCYPKPWGQRLHINLLEQRAWEWWLAIMWTIHVAGEVTRDWSTVRSHLAMQKVEWYILQWKYVYMVLVGSPTHWISLKTSVVKWRWIAILSN